MNYLPIEIIGEIMQFLDINSLFANFCAVDHSIYDVCMSPYNLSRYISYYLNITRIFQLSKPRSLSILRELTSEEELKKIIFKGFATSGGVDEDISAYWVDQLFHIEPKGYCSRENKLNINCAGVLGATQIDSISPSCKRDVARIVRNHERLQELFRDKLGKGDEEITGFEENLFKEL